MIGQIDVNLKLALIIRGGKEFIAMLIWFVILSRLQPVLPNTKADNSD